MYLVSFHRTCRPELELPHPAHEEFVICDCNIENRLHYLRDVTLREDDCHVRKDKAPRVLAVVNSFLLALLDVLGSPMSPARCATFDAHPLQAIRFLLGSLLTF